MQPKKINQVCEIIVTYIVSLCIKFPGIAGGNTNRFITLEIPESCSEFDDSTHNWHENVVAFYLKFI